MKKENIIKEQIKFMCELGKIEINNEFVDYVYNKQLKSFSIKELKELKKEFDKNL